MLSPCPFVIDACDVILLGPVAELQLVGPSKIVVPMAEIAKIIRSPGVTNITRYLRLIVKKLCFK